jgi:hypothetical protein
MAIWLQVLCIVAAVILMTPLIGWADNRSRLRAQKLYETWSCPRCGNIFGPQKEHKFWAAKRNPSVRGLPTSGPLIRCSHCNADFAFDGNGREVDERRNYVQQKVES